MAIQNATHSSDIEPVLASMLANEPQAVRLWADRYRGAIEFWLLTEPIPADTERHLYGVATELHEQFPEALIEFHLVNPRHFHNFDITEIVPPAAQEIRLR